MKNVLYMKDFKEPVREWTTDEMIFIIYKTGGVVQLGKEANFVDHYWTGSIEIGELNVSREELIEALVKANQIWLEVIEKYYANGMTLADVLQSEADNYGITVEELLRPIYDKTSLN
ncbi:hypothetical protein COA08_23620 [Bacillus cereus]|uniref:Uncharacterized protein n=1 Tax=Bacillus cereus TaxID=1396 RepID=A0A2A7L120_BACCE|nr:hypothetical protein [Bacillus cereus]PEF45313.1 hypothetical protein CON22_17560 [Bacillus cereus]PGQ05942.1 hypothetical protein COA08_23620 [Bacillus cereus]